MCDHVILLFAAAMTRFGQERKLRICRKIWFEGMKVELHLSIYAGVLPYLKEYVLIFQVYIA